jgi:hypothetical protein
MAPQVSEKALQLAIRRLAVRDNWLVHCTTDSRRSPPGYPDLTLLKPTGGLMLVLELKTDTGIVTLEQARWLDALGRVTRVHAQVVRPGDLAVVHALLAGHAP